MDRVVWVLFESPIALGAVLFLLNYGLLVYWRRRGRGRPLLVGLVLSVVMLLVQKAVVTQREHAIAILSAIERDLLVARVEALAQAVSSGFDAAGKDRDEFLDFARGGLQVVKVRSLSRAGVRLEESADGWFVARVGYNAAIDISGGYTGPIQTRWRLTFVYREGRWWISRIGLPEVNRTVISAWNALRP